MFLTRALNRCAATAAPLLTPSPGFGAAVPGRGAGAPDSGRGAIAAADIESAGPGAGWFGGAIVAPQKLQNLAPSGICLPHWPQNMSLLPRRPRDSALGPQRIQPRPGPGRGSKFSGTNRDIHRRATATRG